MNQTAPADARATHTAPTSSSKPEINIHRQARELDAVFKAMARRVLVDDDPASELPLRQFRVCAALFEGARSMKELSQELGVSQSAVTQLADRLEAAGMVTRGAIGDDRRVRNLELTERARKLMRIREERRVERVMELLKRIPPRKRDRLLTSMESLKEASLADECDAKGSRRKTRRTRTVNH